MASREVDRVMDALGRATAKAGNNLALAIHAELVVTTPVDTNFARASWIPSLGAPSTADAGSPESPSQAAAAAGAATVASSSSPTAKRFVTNNAHYIGRLNAGSSKQAPAAFVQRAIRTAISKMGRGAGVFTVGLRSVP